MQASTAPQSDQPGLQLASRGQHLQKNDPKRAISASRSAAQDQRANWTGAWHEKLQQTAGRSRILAGDLSNAMRPSAAATAVSSLPTEGMLPLASHQVDVPSPLARQQGALQPHTEQDKHMISKEADASAMYTEPHHLEQLQLDERDAASQTASQDPARISAWRQPSQWQGLPSYEADADRLSITGAGVVSAKQSWPSLMIPASSARSPDLNSYVGRYFKDNMRLCVSQSLDAAALKPAAAADRYEKVPEDHHKILSRAQWPYDIHSC